MANNDRNLSTYQLLATSYVDSDNVVPLTTTKSSWRHWLSWNGFFKGLAITLLVGGAIAIGYGLVTALWPISVPLALFVTGAAVSIWAVGTYKGFFNTLAKWGTILDGDDKPLDTVEKLIEDINKLTKRVNRELAQLNEHEQRNAKFLDLTHKLAKQDPDAASQLRDLYLQSAKQQLNKYRDFNRIVKQVKRVNPRLANRLYDIYSRDNSLLQQETWLKAQQCYQLLAHKNKHLAKQLAQMYINHQQQENKLNSRFQKLCVAIQKQQPELANKLRKFSHKDYSQDPTMATVPSQGYFKAFPCQTNRTWTNSLLKEIKAKQVQVAKLLKKIEVHDQSNQDRYDECAQELATSMQTVNTFYPQLRMLSTAYQSFKTALKDIVSRPAQQSFRQLRQTIKAHSSFKKPTLAEQNLQVTEVGPAEDAAVAYTDTLDNHGLFSKPLAQEPVEDKAKLPTPILDKASPKKQPGKTKPSAFLSVST